MKRLSIAGSFHRNVAKLLRNSRENQGATKAHIGNQSVTEEQRRVSLEELADFPRYGKMFRLIRRSQRSGVALVITLSAVVLLTVLILAFFSKAKFNRQVVFSSTSQHTADFLAHSALDVIVGEVRDEIASPTSSTTSTATGISTFLPKTTAGAVPARLGVDGATGPLVKVSASSVPIRTGGTITGSSVTIDKTSINGRSLSKSRWFTSTLSSPALGTQTTMPTWLFVTRGNGISTPTATNAKDSTSNDYVIGRFAYTVYDIGGLLDINVAGYPTTSPFVTPSKDIGWKSSETYADLTALGIGKPLVDTLVSWRNGATATDEDTYREWASGIMRTTGYSQLAKNVAESGHLAIAAGDNAILTRHDMVNLLSYLNFPGATRGYLTHFSRTINAPTALAPTSPSANATINPNFTDIRFTALSTTVTHYKDDGTTTTYSAQIGDPLVQRRFSLAKLAWLGPDGPNTTAFNASVSASGRDKAILDCFGLAWNSTNRYWRYQKENGVNYTIKTLSEVANENREPNFFESLKAGIVVGSLGKKSDNDALANQFRKAQEGSSDLQIIKIGANIIDSADEDNFPTTIIYTYSGIDLPVHGVEDLPYLKGAFSSPMFARQYVNATYDALVWGDLPMAPILFNPHRPPTLPYTAANLPDNIRIRIVQGNITKIWSWGNGELWVKDPPDVPISLVTPAGKYIVIPSANFENFRKDVSSPGGIRPAMGTDASSPTQLNQLDSDTSHIFDNSSGLVHSFMLYKYPNVPKQYTKTTFESGLNMDIDQLLMVVEYQYKGNWYIYDALNGSEGFTTYSGLGPTVAFVSGFSGLTSVGATARSADFSTAVLRIDPRTIRFGVGLTSCFRPVSRRHLDGLTGGPLAAVNPLGDSLPFGPASQRSGGIYTGNWPEGGKQILDWSVDANLKNINNVPDPDGIQRPADAWLNGTTANLFRSTDDNCRPVVLQRAYRSVAELGYVFRDSPWKSLNFFDESSGDSALLDLFSVADEPGVTAGRSNLNTTQPLVNQALLSGAAQNSAGTETLSAPDKLSTAFNSYSYTSPGVPTASLSTNLAKITQFMASSSLPIGGATALDVFKYRREAVTRSLSSTTQTRTWNLLIDVVAQSGRYPTTATTLDNFLVEGEKRYWLSISIDRYTGQIVDQQLEPSNE